MSTAYSWWRRTYRTRTVTAAAAFIAAARSPPKGEWSGAGRSVRPARTAGSPDGNEQQGVEAGFEQKAERKKLDAGHSQSVGIPTG